MTTKSLGHQDLKMAGWTCIHLDAAQVNQARQHKSYYEFFETSHIRSCYAIFSVPNGYDYFFCNEIDATEFVLRWA